MELVSHCEEFLYRNHDERTFFKFWGDFVFEFELPQSSQLGLRSPFGFWTVLGIPPSDGEARINRNRA
jgi:hypothetical protein